MPTGKVKWYDADRGYGFVSNPGDEDVYVGSQVLPDGVTELVKGSVSSTSSSPVVVARRYTL